MFAMTFVGTNQIASPETVTAPTTMVEVGDSVVVEVPKTTKDIVDEYFKNTPILSRIAFCESTYRQFNEQGDVLRGRVNSRDIGVMQINEFYHLNRAQKLDLDIYTLEGNLAYAKDLYERKGAGPWIHSAKCWNKGGGIAMSN
jgi:hypothetical protein